MTLRVERLDVDHLNNVLADRLRGLARFSSAQVVQTSDAVTVTHDLGVVPDDVLGVPTNAPVDSPPESMYVYVTDTMRMTWTDKVATVGVIGSPSRVWFFKRIT